MIEVIEQPSGEFFVFADDMEELEQVWQWLVETFPSDRDSNNTKNVGYFNIAPEECWPGVGKRIYFYSDEDIIAFKLRWL